MPFAKPISQEVVQQLAEYFGILSEPMRLRILNLLRDGEKCVQELVEATQTSQANVSKHLKVMLQAGVLSRRSEGTSAYYRVEDPLIFDLCNLVCNRLASRIEEQAQQFRDYSLGNHTLPAQSSILPTPHE
ncbi:MAG: helix-turn-helix transcriptional regulator [Kamptonema sp. SIO4C4]|nr:helix-turn-helix transcriptional regulator [Kamptonema sp. SIO4C4]